MTGEAWKWQEAFSKMLACRRCHLAAGRQHVVIYRGSPKPRILFVGEAPGRREDETGLPFMGAAGRVLDTAIRELMLPDRDYGITNVFMCRPQGNRFDPVAAAACRHWLELKVRLLDPKFLVTLGAHALHAFLPEAAPIMRVAGHLTSAWGRALFPMLHPAATIRKSAYARRWEEDLLKLRGTLARVPLNLK